MSTATSTPSEVVSSAGQRFLVNRPHVADECIGDELVIINFTTGKYYGVRGSGVHIWRLLDAGLSVSEIAAKLTPATSNGEDIARQTAAFVGTLQREELIAASVAIAAITLSDSALAVDRAFEPPEIEARDDLQDYLVLDPIHDVDEQGWPRPKLDSPNI